MKPETSCHALPFTDVKKVGAADFYFALNATFRFIESRFGSEGLRRYWRDLGLGYFAPVSERWRRGGLSAMAGYWRAFFAAEPSAEVEITEEEEMVVLDVRTCPAIKHLRLHQREIVPCFCQHCYFVGEAIASAADLTMRVAGGNGTCRQTCQRRSSDLSPQDLNQIKEAK